MLTRRNLLEGAAAGVPIAMGSVASWPATALAQAETKTFVLAHGSWHGGWCGKKVADRLRAKGHAVYTPSYMRMGDWAHLPSKDITINTFAEGLVQVIQSEELSNVILVGHSRGGTIIRSYLASRGSAAVSKAVRWPRAPSANERRRRPCTSIAAT